MRSFDNISDTARWIAAYRALESERPDALFKDPHARALAGERGFELVKEMLGPRGAWSVAVRTAVIDELILAKIADGFDAVVNLGADLDARPWRLQPPPSLHWIEIDLPAVLDYKREKLLAHRPVCTLDQIGLDLLDRERRRACFQRIASEHRRVLVCTEGLIAYWSEAEVEALAVELRGFRAWIVDYISPAILAWITKELGEKLRALKAEMKFAPGGMDLFLRAGWEVEQLRWAVDDAPRLGREPWSGKILRAALWAAGRNRREAMRKRIVPGVALLADHSTR